MAVKTYYYTVATDSPDPNQLFRYFIAYNKRQIKKYMNDRHTDFNRIFDPTNEPVEGARYINISGEKKQFKKRVYIQVAHGSISKTYHLAIFNPHYPKSDQYAIVTSITREEAETIRDTFKIEIFKY